jgi:hypothetical protein
MSCAAQCNRLLIEQDITLDLPQTASAAEQLLRLAARLGVDYIFSNLGSDHPAFIHAFARLQEDGAKAWMKAGWSLPRLLKM